MASVAPAGGADMMRRYFDIFKDNGWAATFWSYKLIKQEGGVQPDPWYMATNHNALNLPDFSTSPESDIESFFKSLSTMALDQDLTLYNALSAKSPPQLPLTSYKPVQMPAHRTPAQGWTDTDIGDAFPAGGHGVSGKSIDVFGGGRDIYEGRDEFHFVSRQCEGDFDMSALVTAPVDASVYSKAGFMFRSSLEPASPLVMVNLFPDGSCNLAFRTEAGDRIVEQRFPFICSMATLRLSRSGSLFKVMVYDEKGSLLGSQSIDLPGLATKGYAGLFVLSHDQMLLSQSRFSNLNFESAGLHAQKLTKQ